MRPDVHAAALRSAAKLVLGMASFAAIGCSSEAADDTGASTDAVMTKDDSTKKTDDTMVDLDLGNGTGEATTKECKATLAATFPSPSFKDYGHATPQPADVLECCEQELAKHGSATEYRWACCFAYDENAKVDPGKDGEVDSWEVPTLSSHAHGFACTPWGPPVPPKMKRDRKMTPRRRDMNRFLAAQVA